MPGPDEGPAFVAFHDTLVIREVESGVERRWRAGPGRAGTAGGVVQAWGWGADSERLFVGLHDGVRELPVAAPTDRALESFSPVLLPEFPADWEVWPIGQLATGELVLRIGRGEAVGLYLTLDRHHTSLAWAEGGRLRSVGAVEVGVDVGAPIRGIGW